MRGAGAGFGDFDSKLFARIEEHENDHWWKKACGMEFSAARSPWASSVATIETAV